MTPEQMIRALKVLLAVIADHYVEHGTLEKSLSSENLKKLAAGLWVLLQWASNESSGLILSDTANLVRLLREDDRETLTAWLCAHGQAENGSTHCYHSD
jgi:hypothetical protein